MCPRRSCSWMFNDNYIIITFFFTLCYVSISYSQPDGEIIITGTELCTCPCYVLIPRSCWHNHCPCCRHWMQWISVLEILVFCQKARKRWRRKTENCALESWRMTNKRTSQHLSLNCENLFHFCSFCSVFYVSCVSLHFDGMPKWIPWSSFVRKLLNFFFFFWHFAGTQWSVWDMDHLGLIVIGKWYTWCHLTHMKINLIVVC